MIHVSYQTEGFKESCPLICTAIRRFFVVFFSKNNPFKVASCMFSAWSSKWYYTQYIYKDNYSGDLNHENASGQPTFRLINKKEEYRIEE